MGLHRRGFAFGIGLVKYGRVFVRLANAITLSLSDFIKLLPSCCQRLAQITDFTAIHHLGIDWPVVDTGLPIFVNFTPPKRISARYAA